MRLSRQSWFCGVLLLAIFLQPISPSQAGIFFDKLDDNSLNLNFWAYTILGQGPTVAEINNRLEIAFPATSTGNLGAGLYTRFTITGDFDEQVDFNFLNWPVGGGISLSLSAGPDQFHIARTSWPVQPGQWREVYYIWCLGSIIAMVETADTSGKLRLKRTGTTIEGFFWMNGTWQSLGSRTDSSFGAQGEVGFGAGGNGQPFLGQLVKIGFNNYQLSNRYIPSRSPALYFLLE
jgi:hypothetical protein